MRRDLLEEYTPPSSCSIEGWAAAAVIGGAAIGAIGSNVAAGTQASGQKAAAATQQQMFNTINQQEQPFIQGGYGANTQLQQLMGIGGDSTAANYGSFNKPFTSQDYLNNQDPGYQFQLQTGGQALRNADTPGVGSLSGAALKDLMSFNQNMASTGYQNAFNRFQTQQNNVFGRLSGIAGLGQNAATNVGTAGTSLGTGIGQAQAAAAGSQAAGIVGATNSLGGAASSLPYLLGNGSSSIPDLNAGGGSSFAGAGNVNSGVNTSGGQLWGSDS